MSSEPNWRDPHCDTPDWRDSGREVEIIDRDDTTRTGELVPDVYFDGTDEYPYWSIWFENSRTSIDLWVCKAWRFSTS